MATTGEPFGLFWDSENGDRTYSAASFEYWLKKFFTSGVFNGDLQVKAKSGMTLEIDPGYANVDGKVKFWNGAFTITLDAANSTYPRIDTIIIRRDNVNRQIICEKVTGSYSADTPQPTAPTRNSEIYDLVTAQIYVGAGVTEITQSNITDTRPNNELCGYITGTVEELDFSAFTAQFEAYFAEFKRTEMADFSEWEIAQKAAYASWFSTVQQQQIQDKADWDAWYAELQEELHNLPADTAEYLQIQIDEIRDNGTTGSIFHITTTNTELEGKTVTVSCGTEVRTATFDANLECTVIGFKSVGVVTITSTDGIQTATRTLNIDYYSKYEVPIAFWSATVNIQGDDNLKGATITVKDSNDATVATVVLNVITGQGVFNAQKADTYTFNYTVSGTSYSEPLAVTEETTYSLSLSAGFDWKGWVDSSKTLHSTDYNSLEEVLADEKAVRELCLEHNCVDYMAEATSANADIETIINTDLAAKWINLSDYALDTLYANTIIKGYMDTAGKYGYGEWVITDDSTTPPTWGAKGNVPIMTANNAPYGEASASSQYSSDNAAYKAFDGDPSTYWNSTASQRASIQYKFTNPICVKRVMLQVNGGTDYVYFPTTVKILGSNDGNSWDEITTVENQNRNKFDVNIHDISNDAYYLYYRVEDYSNPTASKYTIIGEVQFYGRELSVSVPVMTANTTPYGKADGTALDNGDYYYAFNNGNNPARIASNGKLWYRFTNKVVAKMFTFMNPDDGTYDIPSNFYIIGSNDGENFERIATLSNVASAALYVGTFENDTPYKYYGVEANGANNNYGGNFRITHLQFYGLDYSEKEFEVGTTKKWLYDHGLELVDFGSPIVTGSATAEKQAAQLYGKTVTGGQNSFAFAPTDAIDLTNYDLLMARAGDRFTVGNSAFTPFQIGVKATRTYSYSDGTMLGDSKKGLPLTDLVLGLDISSINQSAYPMYADSTSGGERSGTIKEIWLE